MNRKSNLILFSLLAVLIFSFSSCKSKKGDSGLSPVTNLSSITGNSKITLTWENPIADNFHKVVISIDGEKEISVLPPDNSVEITNLTNGKIYNFSVKTIDKSGNESSVEEITSFAIEPSYQLTESPRKLSSEEYQSLYPPRNLPPADYGSENWEYFEFGDFPQSKKADDVFVSDNTVMINSLECHYGSDGNYYAEYNSKFFKLEPVKWRRLSGKNEFQGGNLLFAENILYPQCFYPDEKCIRTINNKTIYPNNYEFSTMRAYLNGLDGTSYQVEDFRFTGFLPQAFTPVALSKIKTVEVDNSSDSTTNVENTVKPSIEYSCNNTMDKVFLLSLKEYSNEDYGFEHYNDYGENSNKRRSVVDYAIEMKCWSRKTVGWWYLRSPANNSSRYVYRIDGFGYPSSSANVKFMYGGVAPAIVVVEE